MRRTASVGIIFFTVFMDLLGFGMVLPLMPLYASDPRFHASPVEIGWLLAIYSLMQFLFAPAWGKLSDRIGRRPVLIIGLFGSALSYLIYGLAHTLTTLFLARAMAGIMGANIAAAQAAMADITPREERTKAMALIGAAFGLGFILGPAMGGFLSRYGLEVAPLTAAAITGLNAVLALFLLGETRTQIDPVRAATSLHPLVGTSWRMARVFPGALITCMLMGVYTALFSAFEVGLPLWGYAFLGWTLSSVGWIFLYIGLVAVVVQAGFVRPFASRLGEKRTASTGLLLIAIGLALFATQGQGMALFTLAIIAAGSGMIHPGFASLVSLNSSPERQGLMMGLFQSMNALGRTVGPVAGGYFYDFLKGLLFPIIAFGMLALLLALSKAKPVIKDSRP